MENETLRTCFQDESLVRVVMVKRDESFELEDMVQYDEAFIGISTKTKVLINIKQGKANQKQSLVAVIVESPLRRS